MRATNTTRRKNVRIRVDFFTPLSSIVSTEFKTEQDWIRSRICSLERQFGFGVDCSVVRRSTNISSVFTWTRLTSGRALLHCGKKSASSSMCLVLRVDLFRLIIINSAEESQHPEWHSQQPNPAKNKRPLEIKECSKVSDMMSVMFLFTSGSVRVQLDQLIFEATCTSQKSLVF